VEDGILDFTMRISLAVFLGFCIGLERQITGHPAGIRINVLICLGACMFLQFPMILGSDDIQRIASYIVSGVGFLCSGVIFKEGGNVRGLNTAATLWCTAAIGVLTSSGKYIFAVLAAGVLILVNLIFRPLSRKIYPIVGNEENERNYKVSIICTEEKEQIVRSLLIHGNHHKKLFLTNLESKNTVKGQAEIKAEMSYYGRKGTEVIERIVCILLETVGVESAGWESI